MTEIMFLEDQAQPIKLGEENFDNKNWYNYENKIWANAMTKDGSMWVWIPRYAYKITYYTDSSKETVSSEKTQYGSIDVKFLMGTTDNYYDDNGKIQTAQRLKQTNTQIDTTKDYTVHPAFTNGTANQYSNGEWDTEIAGFWVAKYAAGFQASTTNENDATNIVNESDTIVYSENKYTASTNTENAIGQNLSEKPKMSYPVFKPLTYAYNLISTGDSYTISREVAESSFYGLNSNYTDSHMMKNSEWGAVTYLAYSNYGRDGEKIKSNSKNLNLNTRNIYAITGYGGENANNIEASTTKNRSGVFDLSGCVWERVAGYISNDNSELKIYGNSYTYEGDSLKTTSTKYATVYPYEDGNESAINNYNNYKNYYLSRYGDAILETSMSGAGNTTWESALSYYPTGNICFFHRGDGYGEGNNAGIFAFGYVSGHPVNDAGFRVVLIKK